MRYIEKNKGITLIALVITIIVLLILAGVTLMTLMGDNGILKQTQDAKVVHNEAEAKEQIQLAYMAAQTESYRNRGNGTVTVADLQAQLIADGVTGATVTGTDTLQVTVNGKTYEIANGVVTVLGDAPTGGTIQLSTQLINTESRAVAIKVTQNVPVPTASDLQNNKTEEELQDMFVLGYNNYFGDSITWEDIQGWYDVDVTIEEAFEGEIGEGEFLDVYDFIIQNGGYLDTLTFSLAGKDSITGTEAEFVVANNGSYTITATDGTNSGSVTVSVDQSRIVNRKDNQPETFSSICTVNTNLKAVSGGVAPAGNGDTVVAVCPAGFAYGTSSNVGNVATGLVITDAVDNGKSIGNEFVWIPVDKVNLTAGSTNYEMAEYVDGHYRGVIYDFDSGTPQKITYDSNGYREPAYLTDSEYADASSYNTVGITQNSLQEDYDDMIASIQEYGGFYVGRYEMGIEGTGSSAKATSKIGVTPATAYDDNTKKWYGLYSKAKTYTNSNVTSSMIWGSQYDAMLNFALEGNDSSKIRATTNGNHARKMTKTGTWTGSDSINNIYDLEGNLWEWTQEANRTYNRALRGSNFGYTNSPAYRYADVSVTESYADGSRLSLYL